MLITLVSLVLVVRPEIYVQNSPPESDRDAIVEMTGVPALLEEARAVLEQHLISFLQNSPHHAALELQLAAEMQEVVHVFVDNSNISIGCQFLPSGTRDFTQRLSIQKFAQAVVGTRQVRRQVVVGSKPPRSHGIWQHWENAGYQAGFSKGFPKILGDDMIEVHF